MLALVLREAVKVPPSKSEAVAVASKKEDGGSEHSRLKSLSRDSSKDGHKSKAADRTKKSSKGSHKKDDKSSSDYEGSVSSEQKAPRKRGRPPKGKQSQSAKGKDGTKSQILDLTSEENFICGPLD